MKVRTRSRLILVVTIVIFLIALSYISQSVIIESFHTIENQEMTAHVQRAISNLNDQEETLTVICEDWASQQDLGEFIAGIGGPGNQTALPVSITGFGIDYLLLYNASGNLAYVTSSGRVTATDESEIGALDAIVRNSIIPEGFPIGIRGRYGMSSLGKDPVILAGHPVMPGNQTDSPPGTLVIARILTGERLRSLENVLQVQAISLRQYSPAREDTLTQEEQARVQKGGIITRAVNPDQFEGQTVITGIENTPAFLILSVTTARPVSHQVQDSLFIVACMIIIFFATFLMVIQLLMQRFILGPISDLDSQMKLLGGEGSITRRVDESGDEEIASLKRSLNRMLDEIQRFHEELRASQETLEERNQQLSELNRKADLYLDIYLDVITYEILNALMGLRGYAELIRNTATGREADFAQKIEAIVKKSSDVIRNIETISRIYKNPPKNHPVNLGLTIRNEMQIFSDLDILTEGCNCTVIANEMLGVVFNNLFSNSQKYGGRNVQIRVTCRNTGHGYTEVTVADNGPGIPDNMKQKVFDRFTSGSKTRSSYGLGLHIVKMLVEGYGGSVRAGDRIPGQPGSGTAIGVTLRCAEGELPD